MSVTLFQFKQMIDRVLVDKTAQSIDDLPDVLAIEDYWWEGMTSEEAKDSAFDCAFLIVEEGFDTQFAEALFGRAI